jgi:regulator of sigma E protease
VAPREVHRAFNRKPVLQRMAIVVAGPLANFLLAIVLYWILFIHGVPALKPLLDEPPLGSPAASARIVPGELMTAIEGEPVRSWQDVRWRVMRHLLDSDGQHGGDLQLQGQAPNGKPLSHILDMRQLSIQDLEGDFLGKLGLKLYEPLLPPVIGRVLEESVAARAGLQAGDRILMADGVAVERWQSVVEIVRAHPGKPVGLEISRAGQGLSVRIIPESVGENGLQVGRIGAAPQVDPAARDALLTSVSYSPAAALTESLRKTWETSLISLKMLGKMLLGEVSMKNLSGPITIADYAGQSAGMGLAAYLGFLALISVSLGVLNLLPIPLLDGGHLLYYVAELAKGSPVSEQAWALGQKIGVALLGTLMVFAIYNDINRLISG